MAARLRSAFLCLVGVFGMSAAAHAQVIGPNCTASIMNRTVQVNANGTFSIPDVPVDQGSYRVRVTCRDDDGTTRTFVSTFQKLVPNGQNSISTLAFGTNQPIPTVIQVVALPTVLSARGETVQLSVRGVLPDGNPRDLTPSSAGTTYTTSNVGIATVSNEGLVTAVGRGQAIISARNEGVLGAVIINVAVPNDADLDGLPDEYEAANGLNPNDPNDATQDPDNDGLSNQQEYLRGTNPHAADTDGDGLKDGDEVARGTNPLVPDTDGDGLTDGFEVGFGTNPLSADTDGDGISDGIEVRLGTDPLNVTATTTILGRVVDSTGAPVNLASVFAFGVLTTQTDTSGGFSLAKVPATLGPIVALARLVRNNQLLDGTSASVTPVSGGNTDLGTIQIVASAGVATGLVTNPENQPIAGAQVTVTQGPDVRTATTDVTGRYRIANLQPGSLSLTARDPLTSLRGRAIGIIPPNQPLTLDVKLGAFGSIGGTVFQRDGATPVGAGINVALSGAALANTVTDGTGRYAFDFVPLSGFTVDATDVGGNHGRTTGTLTVTGQTIAADVAFLGRGTVTGNVRDGAGTPVANATVTLAGGAIFDSSRTISSDSQGNYSFFDVFIGPMSVTARSPLSGLGGQGSGVLQGDGQSIAINVTLQATGTLTGQVRRAGSGGAPVAGARVQLSNGLVSTADSNGTYSFTLVPTGTQAIVATELSTGDRGDGSATITANQTTTRDVALNGQAPVTVIVRDGAAQLVKDAQVTVNAGFGSSHQGLTGADGSVTFPRVFVGSFSASARNAVTQLTGSVSGSAVLGQTTQATITLQPFGSITGTVFAPAGSTPVPNADVRLSGPVSSRMFAAADGSFTFNTLPTGTYRLDVFDSYGNDRAFVSNCVLNPPQGTQQQCNLREVGVGTVTGTVRNPDGVVVPNVAVFLQGPRSTAAATNNLGVFSVPAVPLGHFVVTASFRNGNTQLFGTAQGQITADGQTVPANINLSASLIPTTTTLHDANNFEYNLRENGSLQDGTRQFFGGDFASNRGGALLDVVVNGNTTRFAGSSVGTSESSGRQIGITQAGIGPLNVTRKVFVPLNGYFARYLEKFTNTSTNPVTFNVAITSYSRYISKLQNGFLFNREPRIVSTSNGDAVLDAGANGDHWLVLDDDEDFDPFDTTTLPSVAHVFDGPGAASPATAASFTLQPTYGQLKTEWSSLTLQPGASLAILHFVSQETLRSAAQAAATRLAQVPPEAIGDASLPEVVTGLEQLKSSMASLNSAAQLAESFAQSQRGSSNTTFSSTAAAIASQTANIDPLLASVRSMTGEADPTIAEIRAAAADAATLAGQIRQTTLSITRCEVTYFPGGSPVCAGNVAGDLFLGSNPSNLLNLARTTGDYASAVQTTASNVDDLTLVANFSLPLAPGSTVAPLPPLTGSITGQVFAADLTPLTGGRVTYHSDNALFTRTYNLTANRSLSIPDPTGASPNGITVSGFRIDGTLVDGNSLPVPFDAFDLRAFHPRTGLASPLLSTNFPEDTSVTPAVRFGSTNNDIRFTNSGQLAGVVRRANGAVASNGTVQMTGGGFGSDGLVASLIVSIGLDGAYSANGLPGGTYNLVATLPEQQGSPLTQTDVALITEGRTTTKNIVMAATGGVSGTVRRGNGSAAPSIPVTLRTPSGLARSTSTDTGGRYSFFDIFTEIATVEAVDRATNTAATGQVLVAPDVVAPLDLALTVGGTVTGLVTFANQPVANVQVAIAWGDGTATVMTGPDGRYSAQHVTPGPVTVRAQTASGQGANAGSLSLSGDTLVLNISLFAGGTVTGQVFAAGTTVPVSGVEVTISRYVPGLPSAVMTDAQGRFTFEGVPIGTFTLRATNPANGDRGIVSNQLNANGETRTVNLPLNGVGQVTVTVKDASENLISGARVTLYSQTQFGGNQTANTGTNGTAVFNSVLAGPFSVSATDPATNLGGSATGNAALNGNTAITVHLQAAGSILGRVFLPDGTTGAGGVQVQLLSLPYFGFIRATTTAGDGSFRFDAVPLGSYSLAAYDASARLRARGANLSIASNAQTVTQNLTLVGLGSVSGIVSNPNASPSPNTPVTVRSTSAIGGFFTATTNSDGSYGVLNVPVGGFIATATAQQLIGETTGRITQDGQAVTANIQLQDNAITLPVYRYDGNDFYSYLSGDGAIVGDSTNGVFGGDFNTNTGAFLLDLFSNGTPTRFTGASFGTNEENGQEIAMRQQGLAGLNVTRKIFMPVGGYFGRWLEELNNPTSAPITVDVRIVDNLRAYYNSPRVITTSSGDTAINVTDPNNPDQWVVMGDVNDYDPYVQGGVPATAFVFGGQNAQDRVDAADFQTFTSGYGGGAIQYRWNNVTVPPGGTVTLMHFGVQQTSRVAAQASAQRLVQLPPEALDGLSADEIQSIRNFAVPVGGISALPRLSLGGTISGSVFEYNGTTAVPSANVRVQSNEPIYSRNRSLFTNSAGGFSVASQVRPVGGSGNIVIPIAPFTVTATHPQSQVNASATGDFPAGQTVAVRNVVFAGTSIVTGTVRTAAGQGTTGGGYVQFIRSSPTAVNLFANLSATGTFQFNGVPAGTYTATAIAYHPQGTELRVTALVTVPGDQTVTSNLTLPGTGAVTGVVSNGGGNPAGSVFVDLRTSNSSFYRSLTTTASGAATGQFLFPDVPAGTYILEAREPSSSVITSATVTVTVNQTTTQNLTLIGIGTLQIQVNFASGSGAPSSQVNIAEAVRGGGFRFLGYTDASGRINATSVAVGNFTLRAYNPNNTSLFTDLTGNVPSHGSTQTVTVVLPATGIITGHVTRANGTPVFQSFVEVLDATTFNRFSYTYTDSNGAYTITQLPANRALTVRAHHPTDSSIFRDKLNQTIPSDGATLTVDAALPAIANLSVTVLRSDGQPFPGTRIDVRTVLSTYFQFFGYADSNGVVTNANFFVPEGAFSVLARDPNTFGSRGSAAGTILPANDGQVVPVTVNAPLSGNVTGTVFAADGQTPLASAYLELLDRDSGNQLNTRYSDSNGQYTFASVVAGASGFTLRAHAPNDFNITAEVSDSFAVSGETKTVNVTLPVSILIGTVSFTDGEPVPYPNVFATYTDGGGQHTLYANAVNADGTYRLYGLPVGDFVVNAQDDESGLSGSASGHIDNTTSVVTVDVTLAPDAAVHGTVFDVNGNPVPYAYVVLISSQGFTRYASADFDGQYLFARVPFGAVLLEGCDFNSSENGICANGFGTADADNTDVEVDITLPSTGDLHGTVTDGANPLANARVTVTMTDVSGPYTWSDNVNADGNGNYRFFGVPAGTVRVVARDPNLSGRTGNATGEVVADADTQIDVALGNSFDFGESQLNLSGTDLFKYDVQCDGSLSDGGTTNGSLNDAFDGAFYLTDANQSNFLSCVQTGQLDLSGQQVALGPTPFLGVSVTRKIYVPTTGGFARYLEVIQNPTNGNQTLTFQVYSNLGSDSSTRIVVSPAATSNHYAVTDQQGFCCDPALAHVFGGPGAAVTPVAVQFNDNNDNVYHRWTVTVPANGTAILMHFVVQRNYTDGGAAAGAQALTLVDLSDPHALDGMDNAMRALVVNFQVPPQ